MMVCIETGNLPDFSKIPFAAELFVKDRWTGLAAIQGADQAQTMPEHQAAGEHVDRLDTMG